MATLYITEFKAEGQAPTQRTWGAGPGIVPIAQQPPNFEQTVAIGGSSTASAAFATGTTLVRIETDVICSILFGAAGASPVATAASARLAADSVEYFGVGPGMKVAVITNT